MLVSSAIYLYDLSPFIDIKISISFCLSLGPVGGVEEVPPFQPQVYTYVCDVGKRENVYSIAEKVRREVGEVDILINNAGVVSGHHLLECPDELIERTMVVNCHAHFWVSCIFNTLF